MWSTRATMPLVKGGSECGARGAWMEKTGRKGKEARDDTLDPPSQRRVPPFPSLTEAGARTATRETRAEAIVREVCGAEEAVVVEIKWGRGVSERKKKRERRKKRGTCFFCPSPNPLLR